VVRFSNQNIMEKRVNEKKSSAALGCSSSGSITGKGMHSQRHDESARYG